MNTLSKDDERIARAEICLQCAGMAMIAALYAYVDAIEAACDRSPTGAVTADDLAAEIPDYSRTGRWGKVIELSRVVTERALRPVLSDAEHEGPLSGMSRLFAIFDDLRAARHPLTRESLEELREGLERDLLDIGFDDLDAGVKGFFVLLADFAHRMGQPLSDAEARSALAEIVKADDVLPGAVNALLKR